MISTIKDYGMRQYKISKVDPSLVVVELERFDSWL